VIQVPIAGFAQLNANNRLVMRGLVGSPDGSVLYCSERTTDSSQAETLGRDIADDLLVQGADKILQALFSE